MYANQSLQTNEMETEGTVHANRWMRGLNSTTLLSMPPVPLFDSLLCVSLHCTGVERILATHMRTRLPYDCHFPFTRVGPLDLETRRLGMNKFTLVAELRSSAMSGATDRANHDTTDTCIVHKQTGIVHHAQQQK